MPNNSELPMALRAAYLALHRQTDSVFRKHGITADQFVLMASLSRGVALTQRELASRMSSDPSTVRAMLVLLEKQDLICRQSHPSDSRARTVSLTTAGKRKFRQLWRASESIRKNMSQAIEPTAVEQVIQLLNSLAAVLSSQTTAKLVQTQEV